MNNFNFDSKGLRVFKRDDSLWFCCKDLENILNNSSNKNILRLPYHMRSQFYTMTSIGIHKLNYVNLQGLESILNSSIKNISLVKRVKSWIDKYVVPSMVV